MPRTPGKICKIRCDECAPEFGCWNFTEKCRKNHPEPTAPRVEASDAVKTGTDLITEERVRQIESEGWTSEHDDEHSDESLASAASCYAAPRQIYTMHETKRGVVVCDPFPWGRVVRSGRAADDPDGWHTFTTPEMKDGKDRLRQLVIAGALVAAEIDRLLRKQAQRTK